MGKIAELIASGKTKEALNALLRDSKNSDPDVYRQAIMLSARLEKYEKDKRIGTVNTDTELRNVEFAILQLSEKLGAVPIRKTVSTVAILASAGILLILFFVFRQFTGIHNGRGVQSAQLSFTAEKMKVIGIYPSDIFGIDQKLGLHKAMEHSGFNFEIIDLDFLSYQEMKTGKTKPLQDSLRVLLKRDNIACIIGPSITECSLEILKLVFETQSKVPIFITSAASEQLLNWDFYGGYLNLFRTGTGIDTRAKLINNFLKKDRIPGKSLFLVEHHPTTTAFGELYMQELTKRAESIKSAVEEGKIEILSYPTSKDSLRVLHQMLKPIFSQYDFCFILGVGSQFSMLLDSFYRGEKGIRKLPKFGGWMNGYALNKELQKRATDIANNKIFEITDLDINRSSGSNRPNEFKYLAQFEHDFNSELHPGLRDFAITYDAAICLIETYKSLINAQNSANFAQNLRFDNNAYALLAARMKSLEFEAVSSTIRFDPKGINTSSGLFGALFDAQENKWIPIDLTILFKI